ncbi:hypothetical protein KAW64_07950 [bacterium]|nr:hypothetical protein [bacterium]
MSELRYIEVTGSPRAMGEAHGEMFRDAIRRFTERRIEYCLGFVDKYAPGRPIGREDVLRAAENVMKPHRQYDDAIWQEFDGIAGGAGISLPELLVGNGLTDLRDLVRMGDETGDGQRESGNAAGRGGGHTGECTSFACSAEACGGSPIIGQTWDMHPDARDYLAIVRRRPSDAAETLSLTTVGCLSLAGLNSEGVAVCNNNLVPTDPQSGVNYLFAITRALAATTALEAVGVIEETSRLSGHNFVVGDASSAFNVETTATASARTEVRRGVFVHANHYTAPELLSAAYERIDLAGSRWRETHLVELFRDVPHLITADVCWELLSDNTRGAGAVCNEDYDGIYGESATAATVVIEPADGRLIASAGGARLGRAHSFRL